MGKEGGREKGERREERGREGGEKKEGRKGVRERGEKEGVAGEHCNTQGEKREHTIVCGVCPWSPGSTQHTVATGGSTLEKKKKSSQIEHKATMPQEIIC